MNNTADETLIHEWLLYDKKKRKNSKFQGDWEFRETETVNMNDINCIETL